MVLRKMEPHPEDHIPKTNVEIVEEVLKEQTKTITFLNKLCVSKSSRRSSTSSAHIKELEERLALQEQQSEEASKKYEREVQQRMQAHEQKIEELKSQQDAEIAAIRKENAEKSLVFENKQKEMDALLGYLLRTSSHSQSQPS